MKVYLNNKTQCGVLKVDLFQLIQDRATPLQTAQTIKQLLFLIDTSGSMGGELIKGVKEATCKLINRYAYTEIGIITFSSDVFVCGNDGLRRVRTTHQSIQSPFKGLVPMFNCRLQRSPQQTSLAPAHAEAESPQEPEYSDFWYTLTPNQDINAKESLIRTIEQLQEGGSTAFIEAVDVALSKCSENSTIVAMTDGQTNVGMGFDQCERLGQALKDKGVQFNLIIPFTDYNFCNLEYLRPLYEISSGSILYAEPHKIGEAFDNSQFPIARDCYLTVANQLAPSDALQQFVSKVTADSVIYLPFTQLSDTLDVTIRFRDLDNVIQEIRFSHTTQLDDDQTIAFEYIQQFVSRQLQCSSLQNPNQLIQELSDKYALSADKRDELLQMFNSIYTLLTNPALAKTPSQSDHNRQLLFTLSQNPSSNSTKLTKNATQ